MLRSECINETFRPHFVGLNNLTVFYGLSHAKDFLSTFTSRMFRQTIPPLENFFHKFDTTTLCTNMEI